MDETVDGGPQRRVVRVGDVELCVETRGDPAHPALLLIAGGASAMDWWEDELCARLAAGLRFVVRYDLRDTGESTSYPAGEPGYGGEDLVEDALGLLDALALPTAHLVGISMGGGIAQRLALEHPERVASLVLVSTSPGGSGGPEPSDLPPMAPELQDAFAADAPAPDWRDRDAVVEYLLAGERLFAGTAEVDEPHLRELVGRVFDRTRDMAASITNHWLLSGGPPLRPRLGEITAPTLVVHGTADPLFPLGHGEALAREIPGARLLALEGVGHQMPPRHAWDRFVPAVLAHTSGGWDEQADRLAAVSLAAGDPTGWFDRLYGAAAEGAVPMPWDRVEPHPLLAGWARTRGLRGEGRRAVVVGCGLGADVAHLARLGFDAFGFDVAPAAVRIARERWAGSGASFAVADLLALPEDWRQGWDLVVEIFTVQALPDPPRHEAIAAVGGLVAPGGTLLVVAHGGEAGDPAPSGPPWPLTRAEIDGFAADGLVTSAVERLPAPGAPGAWRWRAELRRPPA